MEVSVALGRLTIVGWETNSLNPQLAKPFVSLARGPAVALTSW